MPVMDEFREEREAIKQKSRKEQWDYFWGYYKWYVIGGAALLAVIIYIIIQESPQKMKCCSALP